MSGVFDKKADKANRREERTRKEIQEKKKVRLITVIVIIVFALMLSGALFINSRYVRRSLTAITIGGVDFTAAEFDYFYNSAVNEYTEYMNSQFGEYAASYTPATDRPHSSQVRDDETGETWADFFINYTIEQVSEQVKYYNAAKAAGFVMTSEDRESMESELADFRMYAEMYGYPSLDSFLQAIFGVNMNETVLRSVVEFINTGVSYGRHVFNSLVYSDEQIAEHYYGNRDNFDSFTYRYFLIMADNVVREDFDTEEEYEEAEEAALAEALAEADRIAVEIFSEDDYIAAAREFDEVEFGEPDSTLRTYPGSWLAGPYKDWMLDDGRQYGDVASIEATTGAYVIFFIERDPNEYRMVSMRQILILPEDIGPEMFVDGEESPAYPEALEFADNVARERAEAVMALFIEGGATEDALIELMAEHSDDPTEGGFYDLITKNSANNKMVPEIEEWLFDPARQAGDYELIKTEAYGYHFVFFVEHGERYCDFLAKNAMTDNDFREWTESLPDVDFEKRWAFMFTQN